MKNMKFWRTALVAALVLTVMLSVTGGTIAWFTDSVTSENNVIKSGNLDVEMYWADGNADPATAEWKDASKDAIFDYALWEPGYTQVRHIKIANVGDLALKYQLNIVANGEVSELADVIDVYFADPAITTDRAMTGMTCIDTLNNALAGMPQNASGTLLAGNTAIVTIALKMQESAGNEYQNLSIGADGFVVKLEAIQLNSEEDSFGSDYDEGLALGYDHIVKDLPSWKKAIAAGGSILLANDVELDKLTTIESGKEIYLNLNGKTLTIDENTTSNTLIWVKEGAKLTIDGDGTIDMGNLGTMSMFYPSGELVINSGNFIRKVPEGADVSVMFVGISSRNSNVTINGGYFDSGYYNANAADIEALLAGTMTLEETDDDIAKRGVSGDKNKVRVALKDNVRYMMNHAGYDNFKVYGGTFVGANPAWGDEGCMLPKTPNYLRPWSYYQGAFLDGQTYNENGIVLPEGYTITQTTHEDGRPVYTVSYSK